MEPNWDKSKLPSHIAFIMDGNGRWAKKHGKQRVEGHKEGVESVREIVKACREWGIKYITLYTFSSENWKRPKMEVSALMKMLERLLKQETPELHQNNVRIRGMGQISRLPKGVQKSLKESEELTKNNNGMQLILCLSYGGRQEIIDGINRLINERVESKDDSPIEVDDFRNYLYLPDVPDPDLVIRTSGEYRVSNFLLWEIAYSELYVTKTLWPDFRREELKKAIEDYMGIYRKFGGVN